MGFNRYLFIFAIWFGALLYLCMAFIFSTFDIEQMAHSYKVGVSTMYVAGLAFYCFVVS